MTETATNLSPRPPRAVALYLAAVQFLFAVGWIVYVVYLPQLAQQAGLEARWVPWLLMADQLVFVVTDLAVGVASDRAAGVLGRLGRGVLLVSLLSALAFALLPWAAPAGSPLLFVAVTGLWVVSTSALRAPPLTLLGRYVAKPAQPAMVALTGFGLGLANALAPYLGLQLKGLDPRWPFLLSAVSLAVLTLGMVAAERALAQGARGDPASAAPGSGPSPGQVLVFLLACAVAAAAFQWHQSVASPAAALRVAGPDRLPWLLPVFWVGFNLMLVPAGMLARRLGAPAALALGAEVAMLGAAGVALAGAAPVLVAAQLVAGSGWALLLCAAFSGALALGHTGREGLLNGALQSTLALAALARIGLVTGLGAPVAAGSLAWWPAAGFALCALLLVRQVLTR